MDTVGGAILKMLLKQRCFSSSLFRRFSVQSLSYNGQKKASLANPLVRRGIGQNPAHYLNKFAWITIRRDFSALTKLLERSGVSLLDQRRLLQRGLHTTSSKTRQTNPFGSDSEGNDSRGSSDGNGNPNDDGNARIAAKLIMWCAGFYAFYVLFNMLDSNGSVTDKNTRFISWNEFVHHMLAKGEVEELKVNVDNDYVVITLCEGAVIKGKRMDQRVFFMKILDLQHFEEQLREAESKLGIPVGHGIPVFYERSKLTFSRLLISLIAVGAIVAFLSRNKMSVNMDFMPYKSKPIDALVPGSGLGVKFADIAGAKEAKQEVMEFVDFLVKPEKYQALGAKFPRGALLVGPPGCGKTLLAKAVATEGQVPFFSMNGSEFIELVGGLGARRIRELFQQAKKKAPCVIYIDEIDSIGRQRSASSSGVFGGGNREADQTLNQLLVEMDGIGSKEGVVVLSSTNRHDVLDKALLRPGRFDRLIVMDVPTLEERKEIFEVYLKNIVLEKPSTYYSTRMASLSAGFTGADIANIVNLAAVNAGNNAKQVVTGEDLEYAIERVLGGAEKRSQVLSPNELKVVAFHESGHVLVGWLLEHTDALLKVTLVPRTNQALGFAMYAPEDLRLYTQDQIFDRMCMAMGGRVAESLVFNSVTTGAQNDLEKITKIAYAQVRTFGFSEEVGLVSFPDEEGREMGRIPYSKKLAATVDEEASKIIFAVYKKTEEILKANMKSLSLLAETLLQRKTLTYNDVQALLGPPPHQKRHVDAVQFGD